MTQASSCSQPKIWTACAFPIQMGRRVHFQLPHCCVLCPSMADLLVQPRAESWNKLAIVVLWLQQAPFDMIAGTTCLARTCMQSETVEAQALGKHPDITQNMQTLALRILSHVCRSHHLGHLLHHPVWLAKDLQSTPAMKFTRASHDRRGRSHEVVHRHVAVGSRRSVA